MAKNESKKDKGRNGKKVAAKRQKKPDGVKVPKKVRDLGQQAKKLAGQPIISEVVAAAMLAAAAALRGGAEGKGTAKAVGDAAGAAGKEASQVGETLRMLALDLARRSIDAWEKSGAERKKD